MEEQKRVEGQSEKDIIFSRSIKAGKRIYYLDVKRTRKDEMYLSITESKKIVKGDGDDVQFTYEKHKIFLYPEDFEKFQTGLAEAISYIEDNQGKADPREELPENEIKIDLDF